MTEPLAAGTNQAFAHTEITSGTRDDVWALWTDVPTWGQWDSGLKDAVLNTDFAPSATGTIVPNSGPKASFRIVEVDDGSSYTFVTSMPGATLSVRRELLDAHATTFTHTVWFEGPLSWLWSRLVGRSFRKQLPPTMQRLAQLAAQRQR
ncbi:MAG: SRPBCC family protein [Ornithinimicrobium sp.]